MGPPRNERYLLFGSPLEPETFQNLGAGGVSRYVEVSNKEPVGALPSGTRSSLTVFGVPGCTSGKGA